MMKTCTLIILILGCASVSFAQSEPKDVNESPVLIDYKFSSPHHPGQLVGGVISDEKAEENLEYDDEVRWDTSAKNPYAYYVITVRNKGTQTLQCLSKVMIDLYSRETDQIVQEGWNVNEEKFKLKPGEVKTIKGRIEWHGDAKVYPGFDYKILAMFSR